MKDILFVTAQPDVPYFIWQIKLYVHNFIENGIDPSQIHVVLGIVSVGGKPSDESLKLTELGINIHHFTDFRRKKNYIPSIKPYLISQWIQTNSDHGKLFFLHDADIMFKELPNFDELLKDDVCYLSDTIGYIGHDYIVDCCGRYERQHPNSEKNQLLQEMCDVIGVSQECIECNEENSGGGQYLIKNTDWLVWQKIYFDCTPLFDKMMSYQKRFPISPGEIQFWTAEMWSLLWNLWYFGIETKITKELDFSWATDSIKIYEKKPILHMAGVTDDMKRKKFYKGEFINENPFTKLIEDTNYFDFIEKDSSTLIYVQLMKDIIKKGI